MYVLESEAEKLWEGLRLDDAIPIRFGFHAYHPMGDSVTDAGDWKGNVWRHGSNAFYVYISPARRGHGWLARTRVFTDTHAPVTVKRET